MNLLSCNTGNDIKRTDQLKYLKHKKYVIVIIYSTVFPASTN